MGLLNRKGSPLQLRLRTSWWTSAGMCAFLLVGHLARWTFAGREDDISEARRLEQVEGSRVEDKYPEDLLLDNRSYRDDPNRWLVFVHVIGIGYMLLGLNTVCDVYFTGALEEMVDTWNIQEDVAGATFMAAGGSAPEFFTSLIGATIAKNDVGFSTIVGSAVFNVLFVIGLCGFVAPTAMELTWWPLFRDCFYYMFGLAVLTFFARDQQIEYWEAIILFLMYVVYCIGMYFNPTLQEFVQSSVDKMRGRKVASSETATEGGSREAWSEPAQPTVPAPDKDFSELKAGSKSTNTHEQLDMEDVVGSSADEHPFACEDEAETDMDLAKAKLGDDAPKPSSADPEATPEREEADVEKGNVGKDDLADSLSKGSEERSCEGAAALEDDDDEDEDDDFINMPEGATNKVIWAVSLPVYIPLWYLTPQPSNETTKCGVPAFLLTFVISLLWIAGFAFCLVWWVEILGVVLGVDEIIMGFTILAAGTSIPDAVSSMAVAKVGHGDMAVSSSIGSNIFDILVGLPIPWLIKTGIIDGGEKPLTFKSPFLTFYVVLLMGMVLTTVGSIHSLGWRLNKPLGAVMAIFYACYLAIAMAVEWQRPEMFRFSN